ncbi:MAG: hypothetical protein WCH59_09305 [Chitinophagia bacterium]|jgi:hypothetical protein
MKKLFSLLFLMAFAFAVNAQSTSPRFGTKKNDDNTGRVVTYGYQTFADAAGADSITVTPNFFLSTYRVTLLDSLTVRNAVVTRSFAGDQIRFVVSAASGSPFIKFTGANWLTTGTATLSGTNKRAVIQFIFDGVRWVEMSRVVQ